MIFQKIRRFLKNSDIFTENSCLTKVFKNIAKCKKFKIFLIFYSSVVDSGQFSCYYSVTVYFKVVKMFFLTGEYNHQLDAKNRIRIPSKMKKELGEKYYFAKGTDRCLFVFPEEIAREQFAKIEEVKISDAEKRRGIRAFTKSFVLAEEDNQGRVVLPANLREFAGIKKDIVFCGVGNRAEIWAKEVFDEYFADDDSNYNEYFDSLGI